MDQFRQIILLLILITGGLNTYALFDILLKIKASWIAPDYTIIIIVFFSIIITLTFIPALVFNYKLAYPKKQYLQSDILDSPTMTPNNKLVKRGNLVFGIALLFQSFYILIKSMVDKNDIQMHIIGYIVISLFLILGIAITIDSLKKNNISIF